jgi:hypothetical protein
MKNPVTFGDSESFSPTIKSDNGNASLQKSHSFQKATESPMTDDSSQTPASPCLACLSLKSAVNSLRRSLLSFHKEGRHCRCRGSMSWGGW